MKAWILSSQTTANHSKTSTEVLMAAARKLGIDAMVIEPEHVHANLSYDGSELFVRSQKISPEDYPQLVLPRLGWKSLEQGLRVCEILEQAFSFRLFNTFAVNQLCASKFKQQLWFVKEKIPSIYSHWAAPGLSTAWHFLGAMGQAQQFVIKTEIGSQGFGVTKHDGIQAASAQVDCLRNLEASFLTQKYIQTAGQISDLRLFVVAGQVQAAMRRFAKDNEFRSNLHQGGHGENVQLSDVDPRTRDMAVEVSRRLGLYYGAVDFIFAQEQAEQALVVEINSFPGFSGISAVCKTDLAAILWTSILEQQSGGN